MYFPIFCYKQPKTSKYIRKIIGVGIFVLLILSVLLCYSESLDNWVLTSPDPDNQDSGGYNNSNGNSSGNNSGGDNPGNNHNPGDNNNVGNKDNGDDNKSEKKKDYESYSDNSENPAFSDSSNTGGSLPPVDLNDTGLHAEQTVEERDRIYEQFDREIEAVVTQIENVMLDPTRTSELEGLHAEEANLRWLKDDYGNNGKSDPNEFDEDSSNDSGFEDEDD